MTAHHWPAWAAHARAGLEAAAGFVLLHLPPPPSPWNVPRLAWRWLLARKETLMPDVPSVPTVPGFNLAAAALASAEEMAKIAEEAPVLIPIIATGAKTLVDLVRNDAPALIGDARTLAADLRAPDAVQAALANDELANLVAQGAIWLERRVAAAIATAKQPTVGASTTIPTATAAEAG